MSDKKKKKRSKKKPTLAELHPNARTGRFQVRTEAGWFDAWRRSQRPRIGGEHRSPFRGFGRILEIREVHSDGSVIRTWTE